MCSQRMSLANLMLSLRFKGRTGGLEGKSESLFCRRLAAILDRGRLDLDIPLEFLGERLALECILLANTLICPVLARGFDRDRIFAAVKLLAVVVLAVPDHFVLARRPGRAGYREEDLFLLGELAFVIGLKPALQVRQP